jgi:hypothetical protein
LAGGVFGCWSSVVGGAGAAVQQSVAPARREPVGGPEAGDAGPEAGDASGGSGGVAVIGGHARVRYARSVPEAG